MKNLKITNLERVTILDVNMYEIENAILAGDNSFENFDYTFYFMFLNSNKNNSYEPLKNEVILNTKEGVRILIKRV